jgi:hypothetical protein
VPTDRLLGIFELMAKHEHEGVGHGALCSVAAEVTGLSGAGIALMSPGEPMTSYCASNETAHALLELEITLG